MRLFADRTFEKILDEALEEGVRHGVDTRQGSVFYDAVAGHCFRTAKFYADLDTIYERSSIATAIGSELDDKGAEHGVPRNHATKSKWKVVFDGAVPEIGEQFFSDTNYFTFKENSLGAFLEADIPGVESNNLLVGVNLIPTNSIKGLKAATLGEMIEPGVVEEADEPYRKRIFDKIGRAAENGNKQHYKTWCESIAGVGRAKIIPQWDGPNTVKAILFDVNGKSLDTSIVSKVQEYIDPGAEGLGEGMGTIGAKFMATAAEKYAVDVSLSVILIDGATVSAAREVIIEEIEGELSRIALEGKDDKKTIIRYTSIGALISGISMILDYSELLLNGGTANISIEDDSVGVLGEVTVNAGVS